MSNTDIKEFHRESFIFYRSFSDAIKILPENDQLVLLKAIINYGLDGEKPAFDNNYLSMAWTLIEPQLDANRRKAMNGRLGGAPKGNRNNPNGRRGNKQEPTTTNHNQPNVNDNVNVNDNANVNKEKDTNVSSKKNKPSLSSKVIKTLEERQKEFSSEIKPYVEEYGRDMCNDFYNYWREPEQGKKNPKMKKELQKTWSTKLRLKTWYKRSTNK